MTPSLGVVGLGRMAQALVRPWLQLGLVRPEQLQAVVASAASASRLAAELPCAVGTDPGPAWASQVVLLAVKPQQLEAVATQAAALDAAQPAPPGRLLVSVLAGV
ncbi:MAG: pyrroline-5-carboxylate reductase, partial [Synechococcaceae bacterium WB9_2_112]|nr:pyrroline-5-carboxylate reductase [Synechococcaceae bacterium WB9_2_112]